MFIATNVFKQDTTPNGVALSSNMIQSINIKFLRNY